MSGARVNRCICFDKTFAELKEVAERTGAKTIVELQSRVAFGRHCTMCIPYVERMLETGDVDFPYPLPPR